MLIGKDLYSDPSIFVRELIQNAIDAVRTREQLDKNLPPGWKGQINIRCWMNPEGYHWFRIEDNGIGMTEDIIMNYLLKIGNSYYSSDTFLKSKLQCNADPDYMPISRFGIGILSCFMGDEQTNQVEISTKHFREEGIRYPALRLTMHGINGYYYLSNKDKKHMPGPMKGVTPKEQAQYLTEAGTAIAVRTNLYRSGTYKGLKEIVDRYVIYPPVAIHYDGDEGSYDYPTEKNFSDALQSIYPSDTLEKKGLIEFRIPEEELEELYNAVPGISFKNPPKLLLKCISLEDYTNMPFLKGAVLAAKVEGTPLPFHLTLGDTDVEARANIELSRGAESLGIEIRVNFDPDFEEQMNKNNQKYNWYVLQEKFKLQYPNDTYKKEVLNAIIEHNFDRTAWKEYIKEKYGISESQLNQTIYEVTEFIKKDDNIIEIEGNFKTLLTFKTLRKNWSFKVCSLSELDWYHKYFKNITDRVGRAHRNIIAHNGILCGDDGFFSSNSNNNILATILLLKDKYRPYLDVARDGVRGLTLETASEIEIIKNNFENQGFGIYSAFPKVREKNYPYIVMTDYCKLLDERDDLAKQLVFQTSEGFLSNESLTDKLLKQEKIEYPSCPEIKNNWGQSICLYHHLCAAFLRNNYSLQVEFASCNSKVFISKKEKEITDDYKKLFQACFFLPDINRDGAILTTKETFRRYACNEYHRLSQFILKNGNELNKYVPGTFRKLLRILGEAEADKLINGVNHLLEHLRKFPGGLFEISEELFLSKEDLI